MFAGMIARPRATSDRTNSAVISRGMLAPKLSPACCCAKSFLFSVLRSLSSLLGAVRLRARESHALLLANHGPLVAGGSLDAAASAIEELEETAKLVLLLGGRRTRRLTEAQLAELREPPGR